MSPWSTLGNALGSAYEFYTGALFIGCVLGPHFVLALLYGGLRDRPSRVWLLLELVYALVNPVVYLLVFQPALFRHVTPDWLAILSWSLLAAYWGLRLVGSAVGLATPRLARVVLATCVVFTVGVGVRDLLSCSECARPAAVFVWQLYAFPILIACRQRADTFLGEEGDFFLRARAARVAAWAVVAVLGLTLVGSSWRPGESETRQLLLARRSDILQASARSNLDPRVVASIIAVTQRHYVTHFRTGLEQGVAAAWLVDSSNPAFLADALDPSLGVSQIKPATALTAISIWRASRGYSGSENPAYCYRPGDGAEWKRTPPRAVGSVRLPALGDTPQRWAVISALLEPKTNIELCAFLLDVYAAQWEGTREEWSIRRRPEILATLFQIGFERSAPKAEPHANEFGEQVAAEFNSPWMYDNFAAHPVE